MQKHRFSSENWRGLLSFSMYNLLRKTVLLLVVVTNSSLRIKLIKIPYWSLLAPPPPPPARRTHFNWRLHWTEKNEMGVGENGFFLICLFRYNTCIAPKEYQTDMHQKNTCKVMAPEDVLMLLRMLLGSCFL